MTYRVIGPIDRYNYGDLLFPLIINAKIEKKGKDCRFYGLVESDLSVYGAVKTSSISSFYKDIEAGDNIIIAGGESLCTTWADLYSYLNKSFDKVYGNRISKAIDRRISVFSKIACFFCAGNSKYPFSFSSKELNKELNISFNAVGGAALATWPNHKREKFVRNLSASSHIGVRDYITYSSVKNARENVAVELVPDSAILMERLFTPYLDIDKNRYKYSILGEYIYFQIGNNKYYDLEVVYQELKKLANEKGYVIVLSAIGHALGHEDLKPLKIIYNKSIKDGLTSFVLIADLLHVFDIMSLIKGSSLYIGTSLHGVITSLSFGVPYVPLNKSVVKVGEYLKEWGVTSLQSQCDENEIFEFSINALKVTQPIILQYVASHKNRADEFLDKVLQ